MKDYIEFTKVVDPNLEKFAFFWSGPFSQWHPCKFTIDGVEYNCAEQWMMAEKARLFGDENTLKKILVAGHPREQKSLGREVKNYIDHKWDDVARNRVYVGNYAKFSQSKKLMDKLLETDGYILVEASPQDAKWGIGLARDDKRAARRETWLGTNWLGEVLTQLRDDITNGKVDPKRFLELRT